MSTLDQSALARWRADPARFIEEVMINPEDGQPFQLLPAERLFLRYAFRTNDDGRLLYPEQVYSCPKKSGKTAFAAMHLLTTTLIFGGKYAEGYALANDFEQAQGRVFAAVRRIVEASPLLRREANITANRISFPETGAVIQAIGSDYASAAGANPNISSFDELWAYTSERSHRLWDEMVPPPTRKVACRLTVTYAGFEGESELLEKLHDRGMRQPEIHPDLYVGDGLLMLWSHKPIAPWQTPEWLAEMRRSLRPNQYLRMIENKWTSTEESFVQMGWWDACCIGRRVPADQEMRVWAGVDASTKRDSTAIAVVTYDREAKKAWLVNHRIFQPSPKEPLDFEYTIEETILDIARRYRLREVRFDPFQMAATAQRLSRAGIKMVEFPQTMGNLTAASQNLYELIKGQGIVVYPDQDIRLAIQHAIAIEGSRGWKIAKEKSSHKIDIVVALAQAALAAVQQGHLAPGAVGTIAMCTTGKVTWKQEPRPALSLRTVRMTEREAIEEGIRFK
jgi:phage terminase large subunit-like protein